MKQKELLTTSRMDCYITCQRKCYYSYEIGLKSKTDAEALGFGKAWHRAMALRRTQSTYDQTLSIVTNEFKLEGISFVTLKALLYGYYKYHASDNDLAYYPELPFQHPIPRSNSFDAAGIIDALVVRANNDQALWEYKSTRESIEPDSEYWMRLRFNKQCMQYLLAARNANWNPKIIIYDVTRKPMIQPCQVPILDSQGLKIVLDTNNQRVFKSNGEPRQTGDKEKGYTLQTRIETTEEYGERLAQDCLTRPEFYFARREVPILEQDIQEFEIQRLILSREILTRRLTAKQLEKPEQAWLRSVHPMVCSWCEYSSFCLQNISVNPANPPAGFEVGEPHQELKEIINDSSKNAAAADNGATGTTN